MMTRREKLLNRPWQLRRYNNHKQKVLNAVSIIDFGPPPQRHHVTVKLKKLQKERERQSKIEEDNFKLLQHLGAIMTSKRVDNYWEKNLPNFLRRVCIYHRTRTPTPCLETTVAVSPTENRTRVSKCYACVPQPVRSVGIPEERVPWDPPKKILTRRRSKSAICPVLSDFDFKNVTPKIDKSLPPLKPTSGKLAESVERTSGLPVLKERRRSKKVEKPQQSVILRQGQIQVVVNFPSIAEVKVVRCKTEKHRNLPPGK